MHNMIDAEFWNTTVEIQVPLVDVLGIHGYLCLALRHPQAGKYPLGTRMLKVLEQIEGLLLEHGAVTREELAQAHTVEVDARARGLAQ